MDFSIGGLFTGLVVSALGMAMLVYGKKQQEFAPAIAGMVLCAVPYFVDSLLLQWGIAVACVAGLWWIARNG